MRAQSGYHLAMIRYATIALLTFATILTARVAPAQESVADPRRRAFTAYPDEPARSFSSVMIEGQRITYLAEADIIELGDDPETPEARIFTISYRKASPKPEPVLRAALAKHFEDEQLENYQHQLESERLDPASEEGIRRGISLALADGIDPTHLLDFPDAATRPVTFSFNGGPGSSSVWLHLGIFGPRRVAYADDFGNPGPPPHRVVPNHESLMDVSDFVFIDPVSTGYSRAAAGVSPKDFHGVESDIESVAHAVRRHITTHNRWSSPKFVAGESYGTTRAAGLVQEMHDKHGIAVNGIVLVSAVLNFQTIRFNIGNDLPYVLFLPTYTATAYHHGALGDEFDKLTLEEAVEEAEKFALEQYAVALSYGDTLSEVDRNRIAEDVAFYTGLSKEFVLDADLRISQPRFSKELLRTRSRTTGRLDSRFLGIDRDDAGETYEYDPSYTAILANYTASLNGYLREELGYKSDLPYEILTNVWPWSYDAGGNNRYLNVADRMRRVMNQLPEARVFIANGLFDLATPHFATEYTVSHLGLVPEYRDRIEMHDYAAGHMMYVEETERKRLREDLARFYSRALP